jgi:hypothetical protein
LNKKKPSAYHHWCCEFESRSGKLYVFSIVYNSCLIYTNYVCLMVYHHPQQYFSYIEAVSFIGGTKPEDLEKTTDLLQVTDKNVNHQTNIISIYHTIVIYYREHILLLSSIDFFFSSSGLKIQESCYHLFTLIS